MKKKKKRSFRNDVITLTLSACIVSAVILGVTLITLSVNYFSRQAYSDLEFYVENTNGKFDAHVKNLENIIFSFRNDSVIRQFLQEDIYDSEEVKRQFRNNADLFSEANMIDYVHPYINSIYLFNNKGDYVSNQFYPKTVEAAKLENEMFWGIRDYFYRQEKEYWYLNTGKQVYICTKVYDENLNENGCCIVSFENDAVNALFHESDSYLGIKWLVNGPDGEIIFSDSTRNDDTEKLISNHLYGNEEITLKNVKYVVNTKRTGFGMKSSICIPKRNIYRAIFSLIRPFAFIFLVLISVLSVVIFMLSIKMTKPLKEMGEDIKKFDGKNLDGRMRGFQIAEFDDVSRLYNEMADRIQGLITEVYEKELFATKSHVKYLQSQINPHFMFNILSMLSMRAGLKGDKELQKLIGAFSKLIQGKIFRKNEIMIPLSEEIELVEFYLLLQSERFAGKITYKICCDEDSLDIPIPRLLIEPLVENAVAHGLEPKQDEGFISVDVKKKQEQLWIQIKDDGVGFDLETLEQDYTPDEKHTHIGIMNTKQMIQVVYGEQASMHVESAVGEGTCVTILLPLQKGE